MEETRKNGQKASGERVLLGFEEPCDLKLIRKSRMAKIPSLQLLCIKAVSRRLLRGDAPPEGLCDLSPDLFDDLVTHCSPLALQNLQSDMLFRNWDGYEDGDDPASGGRKRGRRGGFQRAWKALFMLRWPKVRQLDSAQATDWHQWYWEKHLQDCLDEATEVALSPTFNQRIGDINVPDKILKYILCEEQTTQPPCGLGKISFHLELFGSYSRSLRLLNVLCVAETSKLLRTSKLHSLDLRWIRSKEQVLGMCKLLIQNRETLISIMFTHCKFSSSFLNGIWDSLHEKGRQMHQIQHFVMKSSSFEAATDVSSLTSFLQSAGSLDTLKICDAQLDRNFARMVFTVLLQSSSKLSILDLSENNISGWLSSFNWRSLGNSPSLKSLLHLSLKGNELRKGDMENLGHALIHMPSLEHLDLTDNPIEDDGMRILIRYFCEASQSSCPLANLKLENCELSCDGAIELLDTLSTISIPLKSLCIADNPIGSGVSAALARLLIKSPLQTVDISGIGFGPHGFQELKSKILNELKLVNINISKNRGGFEAADFLLELVSFSPELVSIKATDNLMPAQNLVSLCNALVNAKGGQLQCVDLRGNYWDTQYDGLLAKHEDNAFRPILLLPSPWTSSIPYDDDP